MIAYPIDVSPSSGAVLLGNNIACDGFHYAAGARVQTHIHDDHMEGFETSKGFQDILLTEASLRLLIAEFNADLPYRQNIYTLGHGTSYQCRGDLVTLVNSGHMLGAAQVWVELADGMLVGYSGDFQWPADHVIQVEALVVDSTYGSPAKEREYTQGDAEAAFLGLVLSQLRRGPVHIKSHRGTLQRALHVLSGQVDCPILGSPRFSNEVEVYRTFGYGIGRVIRTDSPDGRLALRDGRFVRFYSKGDRLPVEITGAMIVLSAFMARPDDPVLEYSERSFCVAISNHADFLGTLEYVRATGARYVVTDNTRGGHGVELAQAIEAQLGVKARPSSYETTREWGV